MDPSALVSLPKILLHEHLDGGLRPQTIVELAEGVGYDGLPATDPHLLAAWFSESVRIGGLPGYLRTFDHTIAVLQTPEAIERVAYESAADLAGEGVVYAEVRFAPELNTRRGLGIEDVLEAALAGLRRGSRDHGIGMGLIVDAMRQERRSVEAANAAVRWASEGVVGFDIAGPEAGHPPDGHLEAFEIARSAGLGITIHAGEADGLDSIARALHRCGADRIGHGVRITDDIDGDRLGSLAEEIRNRAIPLELCPRSNVDTGAAASLAVHPIDRLLRLGFNVTLNCDNRLMSATGPVIEMEGMVSTFGWGRDELKTVTENAARAVFAGSEQRGRLVGAVRSGYATTA